MHISHRWWHSAPYGLQYSIKVVFIHKPEKWHHVYAGLSYWLEKCLFIDYWQTCAFGGSHLHWIVSGNVGGSQHWSGAKRQKQSARQTETGQKRVKRRQTTKLCLQYYFIRHCNRYVYITCWLDIALSSELQFILQTQTKAIGVQSRFNNMPTFDLNDCGSFHVLSVPASHTSWTRIAANLPFGLRMLFLDYGY